MFVNGVDPPPSLVTSRPTSADLFEVHNTSIPPCPTPPVCIQRHSLVCRLLVTCFLVFGFWGFNSCINESMVSSHDCHAAASDLRRLSRTIFFQQQCHHRETIDVRNRLAERCLRPQNLLRVAPRMQLEGAALAERLLA